MGHPVLAALTRPEFFYRLFVMWHRPAASYTIWDWTQDHGVRLVVTRGYIRTFHSYQLAYTCQSLYILSFAANTPCRNAEVKLITKFPLQVADIWHEFGSWDEDEIHASWLNVAKWPLCCAHACFGASSGNILCYLYFLHDWNDKLYLK